MNPTGKSMQTDPTEAASPTKLASLVMAGLPNEPISGTNNTLNILVKMENEGKSDYTIESTTKALRCLAKHADLNNPESIEHFIAKYSCSNSYKRNLCVAYKKYADYYKIQWQMPKYRPDERHIQIPTKEKLEMLIAYSGFKMSVKLMLSMECGLRPIELCRLKPNDIDIEQRLVYPTTAKHGSARVLKISLRLQETLQQYISRNKIQPNDKLFNITPRDYSKMFRVTRNNLANKVNDPSLEKIRLYDFRHYFATTLYAKTRDILYVKQQMGHKSIDNTLVYTQLLNLNEEEWTCKTAKTVEEATALIENGFQYVDTMDGIKLYKKRK